MSKCLDNVLLLGTSHNVTKAYAAALAKAGLYPSKVLLLNWENDSLSGPRKGVSRSPLLSMLANIEQQLQEHGVFSISLNQPIRDVFDKVGWKYQEKLISHINGDNLVSYLKDEVTEQYVIFCGGGILRKEILSCGKKFIHTHPGVVPDIRGADCLLWSTLLEKQIGMSVFFMNEGIDTGDVIETRRYPIPQLNYADHELSNQELKDLLVNFLDPYYRAETLVSMFRQETDPAHWNSYRQDTSEGKVYYFMHDALLPQALSTFFNTEKQKVG